MASSTHQLRELFNLYSTHCTLETRRVQLEAELANLVAARRRSAVQHNRSSKMMQLADEILSRIFLYLHSTQVLDIPHLDPLRGDRSRVGHWYERIDDPSSKRAEINISHVCQRWRSLSLRTPALWRVFWCSSVRDCAAVAMASERLGVYLARSAPDMGLELYFDFTLLNPQPESAAERKQYQILVSETLNQTIPHAHRWKNLTIIANDAIRRVSISSFSKAISCISAPRLERFTVCVGLSYYSPSKAMKGEDGWEDQILLLRSGDKAPCPRLKFVKLGGAGLGHCRPGIQSLTHLALELGPPCAPPEDGVAQARSFLIDWPVFLSSDILRLPHLKTLSLHEGILDKGTFPSLEKKESLSTPLRGLKHLRIGDSFDPVHGPPNAPITTGNFLLFFLHFVDAPTLESLIVCGYLIDTNLWEGDVWASSPTSHLVEDREFEPLQTVILSDIYLGPGAEGFADGPGRRAPFECLANRTRAAQFVTISQSHSAEQSTSISRMETVFKVVQERKMFGGYWPDATVISINMPAASIQEGAQEYMSWCRGVAAQGRNVDIIRIPPGWLDVCLAQLDEICGDYPTDESLGEGEPRPTLLRRGRPIRIEALGEVMPKFWPPGVSDASNTLPGEQLLPFKADLWKPPS